MHCWLNLKTSKPSRETPRALSQAVTNWRAPGGPSFFVEAQGSRCVVCCRQTASSSRGVQHVHAAVSSNALNESPDATGMPEEEALAIMEKIAREMAEWVLG